MEDQGKRLLLAVVIAFAIMMAWGYLFPPEEPPRQVDETAERSEAPPESSRPERAEPEFKEAPALAQAPVAERGPEQLHALELDTVRAVFSSYGGTLKSWELKGSKYRLGRGDAARQIDLVRTEGEGRLPFAIGFDQVDLIPERSEWTAEPKGDHGIAFRWRYVDQNDDQEVVLFEIVKTYVIHPDDYLLELTVEVYNRGARAQKLPLTLSLYTYQDPAEDAGGGLTQIDRSWKSACYINGELRVAGVEELAESPLVRVGTLRWAGAMDGYFLMAASPVVDPGTSMECRASLVPREPGVMRMDIKFPVVNLGPGDPPIQHRTLSYLGPKNMEKLEAAASVVGHDPMFTEAVDMGWFGFLARPMLSLLQWFYSFLGNWGLAIIFLTIVVKLATLYWTTKSMRSMKKMAKLKPKIEAIQKKYKDDRQRQQMEVMNLYKAHQVNPLAGCLPMLLQMPIWFALYRMLMAAAELYHAPFIPGWIDDLTATDPYYILPVVLMGLMFLQAKLSPTTGDSTQQKVMMYGLPLTFGVFSFFFPSGLTLYILTNTVLTALHQFWMNRTEPTDLPVQANEATSKAAEQVRKGEDGEGGGKDMGADAQQASTGSNMARKRSGQKKRSSGKSRKRGGAS